MQLDQIGIGYGETVLIDNLSGSFLPGGIHLILGPAGVGKSTLLASLAGFLPLLHGTLRWQDSPWTPEGRVGLAFQNPEMLFFCPTIREEVTFGLTQRGIAPDEADAQGRRWLARWGLAPEIFWERHPLRLSGGEKRRVALAACTVFLPELMLLDEPLAGLDRSGCAALCRILGELSRDHVVMVVTHDPEPFLPLAQRILLLRPGQARLFATAQEFLLAAIQDPELYPLPNWYLEALAGRVTSSGPVPWIDPWAVSAFLWGAGAGESEGESAGESAGEGEGEGGADASAQGPTRHPWRSGT